MDDMNMAENLWLKDIQLNSFSREINACSLKKCVPRDSHILKLCPFLDEQQLLRASGRAIRVKNVPTFSNNPILLNGKNYVTRLILKHYHSLY